MNHRTAMLVVIVALAGCRGGAATVPPPGTGAFQPPNQYYQQPASTPPAFTPPTYGAPGAAVTTPAPGLSASPSFAPRPNVNLASNNRDGLAWQPVTRQPSIGTSTANSASGTINPRTTLTTIRGTAASGGNSGLRNINELPLVPVAGAQPPVTSPLRTGAPPSTAPLAAPMFSSPALAPAPAGNNRYPSDPWRGR